MKLLAHIFCFVLFLGSTNASAQDRRIVSYPYGCNVLDGRLGEYLKCKDGEFSETQFHSRANFHSAQFDNTAEFAYANFNSEADFDFAHFDSSASFFDAQFDSVAGFKHTQFYSDAYFHYAQFNSVADFDGAQFHNTAQFIEMQFDSVALFRIAQFDSVADFNFSEFVSVTNFSGGNFNSVANFSGTRFDSSTIFSGVDFKRNVDFEYAQFNSEANFDFVQFDNNANFSEVQFNRETSFVKTSLAKELFFDDVKVMGEEIDFTLAKLNSAGTKCKISLLGSDIEKIKINMELFELWFPDSTTTYEQKAQVYRRVLTNFERAGQAPSYKILDIEYQSFVNEYEGKHFAGFVQKYGYNYGYNKEWIFYWTLLLAALTLTYRARQRLIKSKKETPSIFVSYRRTDSIHISQTISEELVAAFGQDSVFFDVDTIPAGVDFRDHIASFIERSNVLIIVIGDNWLSERLMQDTDFVRVEIELALQKGIKLIPVLVGEAEMPTAGELPESIQEIVYLQALVVPAGPGRRRQLDLLVVEVRELFA